MATTVAVLVDQAIRAAGIPIVGVSIGDEADRATWAVRFHPDATAPQQTQAASILQTVAIDAAALHAQEQRDVQAYIDAMPLVEKAIDLTILDQVNFIRARLPTPLGAITPAQWVQAAKDKVLTL